MALQLRGGTSDASNAHHGRQCRLWNILHLWIFLLRYGLLCVVLHSGNKRCVTMIHEEYV